MIPAFLLLAYGYSLSGAFSLGKMLAVAGVGLWLSLASSYKRREDVWLLAYLAVVSVTAAMSADPIVSFFGLAGTYQAGLLAALVLVPYWACIESRHRPGIELGLRWGAVGMAVVALLQRAGYLLPYPLPTGDRAYSTMGSPIYVGAAAALALPFAATWLERGLLIACLWATGSRSAWMACAAGAVYHYWPRLSSRARLWGVVAAASGTSLAFTLRPPSDLGRIAVWHSALEGFAARPWFGWGPGNYIGVADRWRSPLWDEVYGATTQDHAHNLFLEAAATSGIPGLMGLAVLIPALWRAAGDRKTRAAFVGVFVVSMLQPLPLVVKALVVALAASGTIAAPLSKPVSTTIRLIYCSSFVTVMFLVLLDRLMTYYGSAPWSYSSVWAAYLAGVIKEIQIVLPFRL